MFVLAEFCTDLLASKTLVLPPGDREERTSFLQQDLVECLLVVGHQNVFSAISYLLVESVLFGWCRCQLFWIHESQVNEISWFLPQC